MTLYNFTGLQGGTNPQAQAGLQQYITQGQQGISPGQAQVAASNPVSAAGMQNLAKAFLAQQQQQSMGQQPPTTAAGQQAAQTTLANGATIQPNVDGQNMGGVGPTVQNSQALQLANLLQPPGNN